MHPKDMFGFDSEDYLKLIDLISNITDMEKPNQNEIENQYKETSHENLTEKEEEIKEIIEALKALNYDNEISLTLINQLENLLYK